MIPKIAIVDYGLGNLFSIQQALQISGADVIITESPNELEMSNGVLLPGVGAFPVAMKRLKELGLDQVVKDCANQGKSILGVCLGLQLLFDKSFEFGETKGLGLISGDIVKFPSHIEEQQLQVPFVGWNQVQQTQNAARSPLFNEIADNKSFYFVHSYHAIPSESKNVLATSSYHNYSYPTVVQRENVVGIQGHPEKSSTQGLQFYKNWLRNLGD